MIIEETKMASIVLDDEDKETPSDAPAEEGTPSETPSETSTDLLDGDGDKESPDAPAEGDTSSTEDDSSK